MLSPRKYHPNLSKTTRRENHVIFGRRTSPTKATVSTSEIKVRASGQKYTGNDGKEYIVCSPGWRTGHVRECIRTGTPRVDPTSNGKVNISANVGRQRRRDRGSGSHQELHPIPLAAHRRRSLCPIHQHAFPTPGICRQHHDGAAGAHCRVRAIPKSHSVPGAEPGNPRGQPQPAHPIQRAAGSADRCGVGFSRVDRKRI